MMGTFYSAQTLGNSGRNQMEKTISVKSDRNIWEHLWKLSTENEDEGGGGRGVFLLLRSV